MKNNLVVAVPFLAMLFPYNAAAEDIDLKDKVVAVDGYYRLKSEVGIYGIVTKRTGTKVVFQPCAGKPQEIEDAELEKTDNTCVDGGGSSFAMNCDDSLGTQAATQAYFEGLNKAVPVGTIFEQGDGKLTTTDVGNLVAGKTVVKIQTCKNNWAVGFDAKGASVINMFAVDSSKLTDSQTLNWQ